MYLFLFFYVINYLAVLFLLKKSNFLKYPSPLSTLLLFYFISNHISLIFLYFNDGHYKQLSDIDKNVVLELSVVNCITTCIFGIVMLSKFNIKLNYSLKKSLVNIILPETKACISFIISLCIFSLILALIRFYDNSALLLLFTYDDIKLAKDSRLAFYTNVPNVLGIPLKYINPFFIFYDVLLIYLIFIYLKTKKTLYLLLSVFLSLSLLLWNLSNTSKGYIIVPFLLLLLCCFYMFRLKKFLLVFTPIALIGVFLASVLSKLFLGTNDILLWYPFERLCSANLLPQYIIFEYFNIKNMLLGQSLPRWYSLLNHDQFVLAEWNWKFMNNWFHKDIFYQNPSSFIAELYANFYYFGFLFIPFVLFYIVFFTFFINKYFPLNSRIVLIIFISFYFSKYSRTEFLTKMFDYRLCCVLLISFVFFNIITKLNKVR
jgi:hypothetical protein